MNQQDPTVSAALPQGPPTHAPPSHGPPYYGGGGDCPILVWMLVMNREYTQDEYEACYKLVKECVPHVTVKYNPTDANTFRELMTFMLPVLMMRHRRIPRSKWRDHATPTGKRWIEQLPDDMPPEKYLHSMIGYHLTYEKSISGMAMTQGSQRKVINIGLGMMRLAVQPSGVTVSAYLESLTHKLTQAEVANITAESDEEAILRRLCIVLCLKQAYIKAIGQPIGFDWSRLEFLIPAQTAYGDSAPLQGWEFRVFEAQVGVARQNKLVKERYQCVCAFFRGARGDSRFIFYETNAELESWVQFINIDQMIKVIPKLSA